MSIIQFSSLVFGMLWDRPRTSERAFVFDLNNEHETEHRLTSNLKLFVVLLLKRRKNMKKYLKLILKGYGTGNEILKKLFVTVSPCRFCLIEI